MTDLMKRSGHGPTTGALHPKYDRVQRAERKEGNLRRVLLVGVLAVTLIVAPSVGFAGEKAAETSKESGLGAAAAVSSLIYGPVKLLYAVGGLVVGSFAWVFTAGDSQVAETVFTRSLRGTYVITPQILLGEESLEFIGRDVHEAQPARTEAIAAADTSAVTYEDSGYDEMGW